MTTEPSTFGQRQRVLWLSTIAFTLLFAVWLMLGVLGVPISQEMGISEVGLGWLGAAAILAGSLPRFHFGIWADRYGGRVMMTGLLLFTAIPCYWVSRVHSYEELVVCAILFGIAGNSFTVGIAWNAAWFPREQQGTALGVFGAGNAGAVVTKLLFGFFGAMLLTLIPATGLWGGLIPGGWRFYPVLYSVLLVVMAVTVWFGCPAPDRRPARGRSFAELVAPLGESRVWQYSLHYVIVFGVYVALSLWLPKFYISVYGSDLRAIFDIPEGDPAKTGLLRVTSLLTALYILPASLLRPLGGWFSDRWGAVPVMYAILLAMTAAGVVLSLPLGLGVWTFTAVLFVLGVGMGLGKAAVYKLIPDYYPRDVGAVGGIVGMLGALGGFVLPPAWAYLVGWTGIPQMTFLLILLLTVWGAVWFHLDVVRSRRPEPVLVPEPATLPG
jgi:NNP family nitrate/nitrite transporter-like MFS transporter